MSAAFQAITDGVRADARHACWCAQPTRRPRARRQALAPRQDASGV